MSLRKYKPPWIDKNLEFYIEESLSVKVLLLRYFLTSHSLTLGELASLEHECLAALERLFRCINSLPTLNSDQYYQSERYDILCWELRIIEDKTSIIIIQGNAPDYSFEDGVYEIPPDLYNALNDFKSFEKQKFEHAMQKLRHADQIIDPLIRAICSIKATIMIDHDQGTTKYSRPLKSESKLPRLKKGGQILICAKGEFNFTKRQAKVIKIMLDNYKSGNEFSVEQDVLEEAESSGTRYIDLFKSRLTSFRQLFERHDTLTDHWRLKLE